MTNHVSSWICTAVGSFPLATMDHAGFGCAFLLVVFMDSGCSQRDLVTDMIQINFLLYREKITDALGDPGVI